MGAHLNLGLWYDQLYEQVLLISKACVVELNDVKHQTTTNAVCCCCTEMQQGGSCRGMMDRRWLHSDTMSLQQVSYSSDPRAHCTNIGDTPRLVLWAKHYGEF